MYVTFVNISGRLSYKQSNHIIQKIDTVEGNCRAKLITRLTVSLSEKWFGLFIVNIKFLFLVSVNALKVPDFNLTSVSSTVLVTWTPPTVSAVVGRYDVYWRVKGANTTYNTLNAGLANNASITNLTPGHTYDVKVVSVDTHTQIDEQTVESSVKSVIFSKK